LKSQSFVLAGIFSMVLRINGQEKDIHSSANLAELLLELEIVSPHCAIALNQEVIPNSKLKLTKIHDGDNVEIVHAVGGGL
tara:strand:+ start:63 stop:305 length:243 start_codon:yes stop_codon:yes gene_type:complete